MAKRKTTVYIDEDILRATNELAVLAAMGRCGSDDALDAIDAIDAIGRVHPSREMRKASRRALHRARTAQR